MAQGITANFGTDTLVIPYNGQRPLPSVSPWPASRPAGRSWRARAVQPGVTARTRSPPPTRSSSSRRGMGARIVPGVRLDYTSTRRDAVDLAPRFVAAAGHDGGYPRTTLKGGVGVFYEPPQPQDADKVFGQPASRRNRGVAVRRRRRAGVHPEHRGLARGLLQAARNLVDHRILERGARQGHRARDAHPLQAEQALLRLGRVHAVARTREDPPDYVEHLYEYDQTHILTVLGSYKLGTAGSSAHASGSSSGNLYTPSTYGFYDENAGSYLAIPAYPPNGAAPAALPPARHPRRQDVEIQTGQFGTYLDVQNVYNQDNPEGVSYNFNSTRNTYANGLPFLPSLGLRGEF